MKDVISVDTMDEMLNQFIIDGMIAMQLSMHDGEPGRHDKAVKDAKARFHSLLISKLPEKRIAPLNINNLLPKTKNEIVNHNVGYNQAIDDMHRVIDEMFRSGDE